MGRRFALFVLAAGVAGICLALVMRHSKHGDANLLTEAALSVLSLKSPTDPFILWLDNHTLLMSRSGDNMPTRFFTRDIHTGREVRLEGLEGLDIPLGSVQASPDGTRLLWQDGGEPSLSGGEREEVTGNFAVVIGQDGQRSEAFDIRTTLHVASLQGSPTEMHTWKQQEYASALLWLNDSRHFMEINADSSEVLVHDCQHPSIVQTLKPRQAHDLNAIRGVMQMAQGDRLVCTSAFRGLEPVVTQADVFVLPVAPRSGLGSVLGPLERYTVHFPPHAHIWANNGNAGIAFSPRGDRIAWWLKFDDDVPLSIMAPAVRFPDSMEPNARLQRAENVEQAPLSLWVCNIDGTKMHSVGKLDVNFTPSAGSYNSTGDMLQWLPDGKALSFQYKDSHWVVLAD